MKFLCGFALNKGRSGEVLGEIQIILDTKEKKYQNFKGVIFSLFSKT